MSLPPDLEHALETVVAPVEKLDSGWVFNCDNKLVFEALPDNSIDLIITDPPYKDYQSNRPVKHEKVKKILDQKDAFWRHCLDRVSYEKQEPLEGVTGWSFASEDSRIRPGPEKVSAQIVKNAPDLHYLEKTLDAIVDDINRDWIFIERTEATAEGARSKSPETPERLIARKQAFADRLITLSRESKPQ